MAKKVGLLLMIVGIPAFGYWAANGCQDLLDSQLRSAVREEFTSVDESRLSELTVAQLCDRPTFREQKFCSTASNLARIEKASVGSGAIGISLLGLISLGAAAARRRRQLLLYIFRPGLYLTALVLLGLVATYAVISIGAIYYGESLLLGRVHVGVIAAIGLGALGGLAAILSSVFRIVRRAHTTVVGTPISSEVAPALWDTVNELASSIDSLRPQNIVVGVEPNFFVTEAKVNCLKGTLSGRTLYCSLPLLRLMSTSEAKAIIAHELAHFRGEDTKYSQRFFPIYRGAQDSIDALLSTGGASYRILALLPAIAVFRYFLRSFAKLEREIGRDRELEADASAAAFSGAEVFGSALMKVHAYAPGWSVVKETSVSLLKKDRMLSNMSRQFADVVRDAAQPQILEDISSHRMSHPTDTHPPLAARLDELGLTAGELADSALDITPDNSAFAGLLSEAKEVEESVSNMYQLVLAQRLGIEIGRMD